MDIEERGIWQVHSTWISAVNAGDLARLLTLMTDDVLFLSPGQPRAGGETTELTGHRITIYRKQLGGGWLLARDAHTLTPVEKLRS